MTILYGTEDRATKRDRPAVTGSIAIVTEGRPFAAGSIEHAEGGSVLQPRGLRSCLVIVSEPGSYKRSLVMEHLPETGLILPDWLLERLT